MSTASQLDLFEMYQSCELPELEKLFRNAKGREEADFYASLLTLALQKKQQEVLRKYPVP